MEHPIAIVTSLHSQQRRLLDSLSQFYSQQILCDIVLKVDDTSLPCHKVILAASSPYFRAMFTGALSESHQDEIPMLGVDAAALHEIIQYLYTAHIIIHNDNVQSVFSVAHLLQLDDLCTTCAQHMQEELDVTNCVRVYEFALLHNSYALLNAARTYILQYFSHINSSAEFMELGSSELDDILCDDNLNINDEYIVFETIMNWMQHNIDDRKQYCEELLKNVRFSLLDSQLIDGIMTSLECLKNGAVLSQCVLEIEKEIERDPLNANGASLRIGMYDREMIIFAGGSQSKLGRSLACYDPHTRRNYFAVQPSTPFDFKYRIDHHRFVITNNNEMYIIGGIFFEDYQVQGNGHSLRDVKRFDPFRRCWTNKSPLLQPRCAHAVVYADNHIYAIGGKSEYPRGSPLSTVESYNCVTDLWNYTTALPRGLAHHGAAAVQHYIYVIGGYADNANSIVSDSVWQFNADVLSWTELDARMSIGRAESGVALLNNNIYVVGGDNGQYKVNEMEIFNLEEHSWKFGPDFPEDRKSVGAVAIDGQLYISGGTRTVISRMNRTPRVVEARDLWKLDRNTGQWVRETKLVQYANSHGCAVGTVNLRRLTESEFVSSPGTSPL